VEGKAKSARTAMQNAEDIRTQEINALVTQIEEAKYTNDDQLPDLTFEQLYKEYYYDSLGLGNYSGERASPDCRDCMDYFSGQKATFPLDDAHVVRQMYWTITKDGKKFLHRIEKEIRNS